MKLIPSKQTQLTWLAPLMVLGLSACGGRHMDITHFGNTTTGTTENSDTGSLSQGPSNAGEVSQKPGGSAGPAKNYVVYSRDILPIIKARCSECHPGKAPGDWTNYNTALAKKDRILQRITVSKDMPKGKPMSDEERALIGAWIRGGALKDVPAEGSDTSGPIVTPAPIATAAPTPTAVPTPAPTPTNVVIGPNPTPSTAPTAVPSATPTPSPTSAPVLTTLLTYEDTIRPIIEQRCAMCHNADSDTGEAGMPPNWLDYKRVFEKRDRIIERVVNLKDMPMGDDGMPEQERQLFKQWIDAGAPQNKAQIVTYKKDIRPIIEQRCSMCHNPDGEEGGMPNWLDYKRMFEKRDRVMERVVKTKDMPMGDDGMPDSERNLFNSWILEGALEDVK